MTRARLDVTNFALPRDSVEVRDVFLRVENGERGKIIFSLNRQSLT